MTNNSKAITIDLSQLDRREERCCCFRGLDSSSYNDRVMRYHTRPHIRGASLYDGDRLVAVGELIAVETAADRLNSGGDVDHVLRGCGLIG